MTGAAYVPIDVESWSEERMRFVIEKVKAEVVLEGTGAAGAGIDMEWFGGVIVPSQEIEAAFSEMAIEDGLRRRMEREIGRPWESIEPEDLSFMLFTSGTTSAPKGVMLPHRGILHYVQQGDPEAPFNTGATPEDKVLLIFSPAFDGKSRSSLTSCNSCLTVSQHAREWYLAHFVTAPSSASP